MVEITDLRKVVAEVEQKEAEEIIKELLAQGVDPFDVLEDGIVKGLNDLGARFQAKKAIIPDLVKGGILARTCIPHIQAAFQEMGMDFWASMARLALETVTGQCGSPLTLKVYEKRRKPKGCSRRWEWTTGCAGRKESWKDWKGNKESERIKCPKCQFENREGAKFCNRQGVLAYAELVVGVFLLCLIVGREKWRTL
jgi:hypothetical protein